MPVTYSFKGRLFRLDCIGEYTVEEMIHAFTTALEDPDFPLNAVFLMDVTESISLANRKPGDIRQAAGFIGPKANQFSRRCAIVAPSNLYYGFMRMASVYVEEFGLETMVFWTEEEALEWLGVD